MVRPVLIAAEDGMIRSNEDTTMSAARRTSYDDFPYQSVPLRQTHPDHLAPPMQRTPGCWRSDAHPAAT